MQLFVYSAVSGFTAMCQYVHHNTMGLNWGPNIYTPGTVTFKTE